MTPRTERRRSSDLEITGPFGLRARFFGKELTGVMLLVICAFGIGYLIYQHDRNSMDSMKHVVDNQRAIIEQFGDMIYVLKLQPSEREKLNLEMPDSVRKKLREGK